MFQANNAEYIRMFILCWNQYGRELQPYNTCTIHIGEALIAKLCISLFVIVCAPWKQLNTLCQAYREVRDPSYQC